MNRCECVKEQTSQSEHSPGLVRNDEPIVYALVDPLSFEQGSIKALKHDRLKKSELSVCRATYVTGEQAKALTTDVMIASNATRTDEGFAWAICSEIREIKLDAIGKFAFCVIDDAYAHFPAHAHIGYSDVDDKKNERAEARGNLLLLLKRRGIFKDWSGLPFALAS